MFNNLSANTGESIRKANTETQLKNVYKCINEVEERVNDNCACNQCLQSQLNNITQCPQIVKDTGTFINLNTDNLCSTNPIVAPGVQNDWEVQGDIKANNADITGNATVGGNLKVCGCLDANIDDLAVTNETAQCSSICIATIADATIQNISNDCITTNNLDANTASIDNIQSDCIGADCVEADNITTECVNALSISTTCLNSQSSILSCSVIDDGKIEVLKNSKSIGEHCIVVPFEPTADFYRLQIPREFTGEVKLWNCDMSININTTDCHRNAMIIYSNHNADVLKGFYRNNDDERLYIEFCSCCPLYYEYRTPQKCVYNFEDNHLICACTEAGAIYSPDCTLYCAEGCSHIVIMNTNGIPDGLTVCGSLKATYLEFQCGYFPGGLVLDSLCVNGPSWLDGDVHVGVTCCNSALYVCTCTDTNCLHVHCVTQLGDRLTSCEAYCLSTEWKKNEIYYTYDDQTEEYTCIGCLEFEQWTPNCYYWHDVKEASTICVIATSDVCGDITHKCNYTQTQGDIVQCNGCYRNIDQDSGATVTIDDGAQTFENGSNCYTIGNSSATMTDGTSTSRTTASSVRVTNDNGMTAITAGGAISQDANSATQITPDHIQVMDADSRTVITADGIETPGQVVSGNLTVCGDIYQCGSAYCTHAEDIYSKCDYIHLREDAQVGLSAGCYSGVEVLNYDGTRNTAITTDNTGMWCVGTSDGTMEPIATRSPHDQMCDHGIVLWDATHKCLYTQDNLCNCSNVVYYNHDCNCFYTGSFDLTDACPVKWCSACKCFYTDCDCHETFLCGLGPIVLGCCCVTDPITGCVTEYCTVDAPWAVTSYEETAQGLCPNQCVKVVNITRACFDCMLDDGTTDDCAYYFICDEWSGGLSFNDFCAGCNMCLCVNALDGHLYFNACTEAALTGICGGQYTSVTHNADCTITIDTCAIDTSCYCAGNGIVLACNDDELTISSKVCITTQACYDASAKCSDWLYTTTDTCRLYQGTNQLNYVESEPIGTVKMFYGTAVPNDKYLPLDGRTFDAAEYPDLYQFLGTNTLPNMKEAAPVMIGCRTGETYHDNYAIGDFHTDAVGSHSHGTTVTCSLSVSACDTGHSHGVTWDNNYRAETDKLGSTVEYVPGGAGFCWAPVKATIESGCANISVSCSMSVGVTVNDNAASVANHGKRFGLLFMIRAK